MCTCTQSKMRETPEYNTYQCKTAGKYAFVRKTCEKRSENTHNRILISLQIV